MTNTLYDTDFDAWVRQQAEALCLKGWSALDIEHLAEEVEGLRDSERKAVRGQIRRLMSHLLKWHFQPQHRSRSWQATIVDVRRLLADDLEDNPTLAREPSVLSAWAYQRARREAVKDTGLPQTTFPEACPWTLLKVLEEDFLPHGAVEIQECPPRKCGMSSGSSKRMDGYACRCAGITASISIQQSAVWSPLQCIRVMRSTPRRCRVS